MVIVLLHQEDVLLRKHIEKHIARFVDEEVSESRCQKRVVRKREKSSIFVI